MSGERTEHVEAIGVLVVTAVMWSLAGVLIKEVSWHPVAISGVRSAVAAVVMLAVVRRKDFNFSRVQIAGAVFYATNMLVFVASTKLTTAANAIVLQYTAPIYVALLSAYFLKEKTNRLEWVTVAAAVGGMAMFFFDKLSTEHLWGNLLGIVTGLSFALSIMCMRKQKDGSPAGLIFMGNVITAVAAIPFMFGSTPDIKSISYVSILGVVQLGVPYIFYAYAIKRVTALEGIMVPVIEPILNPIWVFLFIGEVPGKWALPGGIIVIASAVMCSVIRIRSKSSE